MPAAKGYTQFTDTDRKELMRQGIQLDMVIGELARAKVLAGQDLTKLETVVRASEVRVESLEAWRMELKTQIKTSLSWISLLVIILSSAISILFKFIKIVP